MNKSACYPHGVDARVVRRLFALCFLMPLCNVALAQAGRFERVGTLNVARNAHTSTLLDDGRVLVLGGFTDGFVPVDSAEIYEPTSQSFRQLSAVMSAPRAHHAVVRLTDGSFLVTGGSFGGGVPAIDAADLFHIGSESFEPVTSMSVGRMQHTATLLNDGKALITGGITPVGDTRRAELYDPGSRSFSLVGSMADRRAAHFAFRLESGPDSGKVIIVGGRLGDNPVLTAELYDPLSMTFGTPVAIPKSVFASGAGGSIAYHTADGKILFIGYEAVTFSPSAITFDPLTETFAAVDICSGSRQHAQLPGGRIFLTSATQTSSQGLVFDPAANTVVGVGRTLTLKSSDYGITTLTDGSVLLSGGLGPSGSSSGPNERSAELFISGDPQCVTGNVNSRTGPIRNVLSANGRTGIVDVLRNTQIQIRLDAAPGGPGGPGNPLARYVLWVWRGCPFQAFPIDVGTSRLGCVVNPTPLQPFASPQAFLCLNGGLSPVFCAGLHEFSNAPSRAPWSRTHGGFSSPVVLTLQGVLQDNGSSGVDGYSITNALIVSVH